MPSVFVAGKFPVLVLPGIFNVKGNRILDELASSEYSLRRSCGSDLCLTANEVRCPCGGVKLGGVGTTFSSEYRRMSSQPLCVVPRGGEIGDTKFSLCF